MGHHFADRLLGDEADVRRHALFASHCRRAGRVEMYLLLSEIQCRTAFANALSLHTEHAFIKLQTAVDISDGQVQVVNALDLHANLVGYGSELGTGRDVRLSKSESDYPPETCAGCTGVAKS